MRPHHRSTVDKLVAELEPDESILALLLTGSIVHGFAADDSDVDVAAVVSADTYRKLDDRGGLTFLNCPARLIADIDDLLDRPDA